MGYEYDFTTTPAEDRCTETLRLMGQPVALRCGKPKGHEGRSHGSNMNIRFAPPGAGILRTDYITVLWMTAEEPLEV